MAKEMIYKPKLKVLPYIQSVWIGNYEQAAIRGRVTDQRPHSFRYKLYNKTPHEVHRLRFRRWFLQGCPPRTISIPFH